MGKYDDIDVSRYTGHTPGPWMDTAVSVTTAKLNSEARKHIVFRPSDYNSNDADMRLIADSPDLLNAYQDLSRRVKTLEAALEEIEYEDDCVACQEKARIALQEQTNER